MTLTPNPDTVPARDESESEEASTLSRQALEQLAKIDAEISRRRERHPLRYAYKPHAAQRKIHESHAKVTACFAANRVGKSIPCSASVLTPDGWVAAGSIKLGDTLIGGDGQPTKVCGVYPQGELPVYSLSFSDGTSATCSLDHLWKAMDYEAQYRKNGARYQEWGVYSLQEIVERTDWGTKNLFRFPLVAPVRMPERSLPVDPYVMGVFLGDGSLRNGRLLLSSADDEIINTVRSYVEGLGAELRKTTGQYDYAVIAPLVRGRRGWKPNNHLKETFAEADLCDRYSHEKFVPQTYLLGSINQRLALLQGLMDTDGWSGKNSTEFCSTSEALADAVVALVRSLGGTCKKFDRNRWYTYKGERRPGRRAWTVRIYSLAAGNPFRLKRKLDRWDTGKTRTSVKKISGVQPAGVEECVCFEVDSHDRTFVIDDYVVTHNTLAEMAEIFWRCEGTHPYKKTHTPPVHTWWVVPSYSFWEEVVVDSGLWADWAPRQGVNIRHHPQLKLEFDNGSTCTIMSQEMGLRRFMGAAPRFICVDEKCDEAIFGELVTRIVTSRGQLLYAATLVEGVGWEYDALWLPGTSGESEDVYAFTAALCARDPSRELEIGKPLVPHLSRRQILQLARTIPDPQMRNVRIFGEIAGRTGLILPYDRDIHLIDPISIKDWWPVWAGCDPAFRGFAVAFMTVTPEGHTVMWDEYFSQRQPARKRTDAIRRKYDKLKRPLDDDLILYVDTANPQEVIEMNTWFYELEAPIVATTLEQSRKLIKPGIDRMIYMMDPNDELKYPAQNLWGSPKLLLFNDMRSTFVDQKGEAYKDVSRTTWEMQRWQWKKPSDGRVEKDEPDDYSADGAHMMDALRYALMARFGPIETPEEYQSEPSPRDIYSRMRRLR